MLIARVAVIVMYAIAVAAGTAMAGEVSTFCNPLNLDYVLRENQRRRRTRVYREAADPVVVLHKDHYYLFASHSAGYWRSFDMRAWEHIRISDSTVGIVDRYAPAVWNRNDTLFWASSEGDRRIYCTGKPGDGGSWRLFGEGFSVNDPAVFGDDDGKYYLYSGLGGDISCAGLDPAFAPVDSPMIVCLKAAPESHGFERHPHGRSPFIEGAWMNKHAGVYYLQYAAPGTEFKVYADGLYTSKEPLGPFTYAPYSPVSSKPTGFIGGAGHGCLFRDKHGKYWRAVTMSICVRHIFERRIGLFPAAFDKDGVLHTNTVLGDYPQFIPGRGRDDSQSALAGWMLLSYNKPVSASSSREGRAPENAVDEDVTTWWEVDSSDTGGWLSVDLGADCSIRALQVNFTEQRLNLCDDPFHRYVVERSSNGKKWRRIVDRSSGNHDVPHDYAELKSPVRGRYVKITVTHMPCGGACAIAGLRVFGSAPGRIPAKAPSFTVSGDSSEPRRATVSWQAQKGVSGWVVRYGTHPSRLYNNYQTRDTNQVTLDRLNRDIPYYYAVDAFNETGLQCGSTVKSDTNTVVGPAE